MDRLGEKSIGDHMPDEIDYVEVLRKLYGSLEEPNFSFMEKAYKKLLRHELVFELMSSYFIRDDTDLNDHCAVHLCISHPVGKLMLCLSFIDSLAMLFRIAPNTAVYESVIETNVDATLPPEKYILERLEHHRFRLLSKREALMPVQVNLPNTDPGEVILYHATISDCTIIPQVLLS